jgi:hypothetical protein
MCYVLAGLTSRSPEMVDELRRPWYLLDSHNNHIRPRYMRSAANPWADNLSHHLDNDDWQLDPLVFDDMETQFGPHTIDRFAEIGPQTTHHTTSPLQRKLARPVVRSGGLPSLRRYPMARGKQLVQPPLATTT